MTKEPMFECSDIFIAYDYKLPPLESEWEWEQWKYISSLNENEKNSSTHTQDTGIFSFSRGIPWLHTGLLIINALIVMN